MYDDFDTQIQCEEYYNEILEECQAAEYKYIKIKTQAEQRQKRLDELREECRALGIDPDTLEETIEELTKNLESIKIELKANIDRLTEELAKLDE